MDSRTLTSLLSFMADNHEVIARTHSKFKPEYMRGMLASKFPSLTEAQIKHIMRII